MRYAIGLIVLCLSLGNDPVSSAEPGSSVSSAYQSTLTPLLVCPPKYSTPMVIPADELLREANTVQPLTKEGWIVQNRPVSDCANYVGDAETRFREHFKLPLQLQRYNSQIRLLEAEAASLQRRMANYKYFNKAGALFITVENTRLAYIATQEQLRNLRYERTLFVRLQNLERELGQGVPIEPNGAF
jgi:hypothetical protein